MIIDGTAQNDVLTGTDDDDTIRGLGGTDALFGRGGDDFLFGGTGNDRLDGNRGADRMEGEAGNDQYYVNDPGDTVLDPTGGRIGGIDQVFTSVSFVLGDNLEHLTMYATAELGRGNDLANIIRGNASDNVLQGLRGDDVIFGGLGNDRLDGGLGADTLAGGDGDDAYYADSRLDVIVEGAAGGIDTLFTSDSRKLDANIENLTMYGRARNAVGNELDNAIIGNSAANVILGGLGNDTLSGGQGDDNLRGGDGDDVISGGMADYTFVDFEETGQTSIEYEDDGQDTIDGGEGNDTVVYSDIPFSPDFFTIDRLGIDVIVDLRAGTAIAQQYPASSDLLVSIENVSLGSGDDTVFGDDLANEIRVGNGTNQVFAGAGNDVVVGGSGIDLDEDIGGRDLSNILAEVLRGDDGDDIIYSNGSFATFEEPRYINTTKIKDILIGGNGNDRLVGAEGLITMVGGEGSDTFEFFDMSFYILDNFGSIELDTRINLGGLSRLPLSARTFQNQIANRQESNAVPRSVKDPG